MNAMTKSIAIEYSARMKHNIQSIASVANQGASKIKYGFFRESIVDLKLATTALRQLFMDSDDYESFGCTETIQKRLSENWSRAKNDEIEIDELNLSVLYSIDSDSLRSWLDAPAPMPTIVKIDFNEIHLSEDNEALVSSIILYNMGVSFMAKSRMECRCKKEMKPSCSSSLKTAQNFFSLVIEMLEDYRNDLIARGAIQEAFKPLGLMTLVLKILVETSISLEETDDRDRFVSKLQSIRTLWKFKSMQWSDDDEEENEVSPSNARAA